MSAVETGVPEALGLLGDLVAARPTVGEEAGAQAVFADAMARLGLSVRELPVPAAIAEDPAAGVPQGRYAGRANVLARTADGDLRLLINGHIDVVPAEAATWSTSPWIASERDGWIHGRGAGDMKGGFAMVWLALDALRRACPEVLRMPIGVLSVIEEECTGNGTLAALRAGVVADEVLLAEPTDLRLLVGGIGIVWADVELTGSARHAHVAEPRDSVLDVLVALMPALRDLGRRASDAADTADAGPYNVNVGTVRAGDWPSSAPGSARLGVRFGHPSDWSSDRALGEIEAVVAECCRGTSITAAVTPSGFRAAGYRVDDDSPLVARMQAAHAEAHGEPCPTFTLASTTDARYYVNELGVPAVCFGPVTRNMHGADEAVEIASIVAGAKTLAVFLARQAAAAPTTERDALDPVAGR